jgi:hypothetical protein
MKKLKKADVELIITVLGGVLLGLVAFISTSSLSEMLILQKSSLLGTQFLEGIYLTHYFFLKELAKEGEGKFTKENPFIYEINANIPITSLEIGDNGFKINNFCFFSSEESSKTWLAVLGFAAIKETLLITGATRTKVKNILKKITSLSKLIKLTKFYSYLQAFFYFQSKLTIFTNQKICILEGDQLVIKMGDIKTIIKKDKNSNKIGKNLVFKAYLENQNIVTEIGVN